MTDFVIRNDIPMPQPVRRSTRSWPFKDMKVGDSVDIPYKDVEAARSAYTSHAHAKGKRFTSRTIEGQKLRVWRYA